MTITELTQEQKDKLPIYRDEALKIGLDTNDEYDLALVKDLINEVRGLHDTKLPKVKNWITQYDSPFAACKNVKGAETHNASYGQHDIYWLQFYWFFRQELNLKKETEQITALYELCKHIGWFWIFEDSVIITRKPSHLGISTRKASWGDCPIIHDTEGMAIQYRDGTGVYKLDDIRIPKEYHWLFHDKSRRNPKDILGINNVDIRNAALKLLSPEGLLGAVDYDVLHTDNIEIAHTPDGGKIDIRYTDVASIFNQKFKKVENHYKLVGFEMNGQYRKYLVGECPSKKEKFMEAVHPACKTIQEALNWRESGVVNGEYTPPIIRT